MRLRVILTILWTVAIPTSIRADPRKPEPAANDRKHWFQQHASDQQLFKGDRQRRVCFLGDSLIAFWKAHGQGSWELDFSEFSPANCGIAGDRIEHVHYRARLIDFGKKPPEVFVILAGTNNFSRETPDDPEAVAGGIGLLVATLKSRCPNAGIIVISILPSGYEPDSALRKNIITANRALETAAETGGYNWIDSHDLFIDSKGKWKAGLTLDGTHLTSKGYDILAKPIVRILSERLKSDSR